MAAAAAAAPLPARFVSASLGRRLSNHLDAVLLELRSEQRILVLQLFDLENKNEQKKKKNLINNIFILLTARWDRSEFGDQTFSFEDRELAGCIVQTQSLGLKSGMCSPF